MKFAFALAIKLGLQLALLAILLPWLLFASIGGVVATAIVLWIASFLLADLIILPMAGAAVAAVADFVITGIVVMLMLRVGLIWAVVWTAVLAGILEYIFHCALLANGLVHRHSDARA